MLGVQGCVCTPTPQSTVPLSSSGLLVLALQWSSSTPCAQIMGPSPRCALCAERPAECTG